jgi:hypothetical protein
MIPPLTDLPTGSSGEAPMAAGVPVVAVPTLRFADLLVVDPASPAKVEVQAERFNQDGFFGTSVAMSLAAAGVAVVQPVAPEEPAGEVPVAARVEGPAVFLAASAPIAKAAAPVVPPMSPGFAKPAVSQPIAPTQATAPMTAPRAPSTRSDPAAPVQPRPPMRQRPLPTGSFVAVAVQAVAHGIEVVAHVASLDERDRAALADKVAALLAAHGYAPAHIIITAMSGTRQEAR